MTERTGASNDAQIDYWNSKAGETWAKLQRQLDRQTDPLGHEAMRVLAPRPGERVLDIGCGCGQTSLELAAAVSPAGSIVAVDVSRPMLAVARARLQASPQLPLEFRQADAQTARLGTHDFDAAFSRFGVMFFGDPVAAFANVRAALRPGGRLAFVCWRALAENRWMLAPLEAARALLPAAEPVDPNAPGPFAFADQRRLRSILGEAGFHAVVIEPFDSEIGGGDLEEAVYLACRVGPLGALMRDHPQYRDAVAGAVRESLLHYLTPNGVFMSAAVWIVRAANGAA